MEYSLETLAPALKGMTSIGAGQTLTNICTPPYSISKNYSNLFTHTRKRYFYSAIFMAIAKC